jgi:uncharacterized protein involved in exopolysaccharide biosynthesis
MSDLIRRDPGITTLERVELLPSNVELNYPFGPQKDLRDYGRQLMSRKSVILACVVCSVGAAAFYTWRQTPIYEAAAKVEVDIASDNVLPYQDVSRNNNDSYSYQYEEFLQTQIKHLMSRDLAKRVALAFRFRQEAPGVSGMEEDQSAGREALSLGDGPQKTERSQPAAYR